MSDPYRPTVLIILDGWGNSSKTQYNAVANARKPCWDKLIADCPNSQIYTSGAEVGLPTDQMGNSEVGHLNLGSGRVVYQEFTRVSRAIRTGSFYANQTLTTAVDTAMATDSAVHILGLLSPGGVHSHEEQIHAMAELAHKRGAQRVYLHAFLDGRDTPPKSAAASIKAMEDKFTELGNGRIVSVIGRYYAMDRDHRWPRVKEAYDLISMAKGSFEAADASSALDMAYERGETDEFVKATAIIPEGELAVTLEDGDVIVMMNYRSDRARQITRPFVDPEFDDFEMECRPRLGSFVSLTEYSSKFDIPVAFPAERLQNVFGAYISKLGLHQLRIAETEKYAHVTFFFNGGEEEPFEWEDRILVPSPDVATYDLQPEMSAVELTDKLVDAIESEKYDVIICNYANPDMVGHTGNYDATVKAIEALDSCLQRVVDAIDKVNGEALITADHGNAEKMRDTDTGQPHTAHTTNPVPLIYVGQRDIEISPDHGVLADIAPTMLYLMGLDLPSQMTGRPLLTLRDA